MGVEDVGERIGFGRWIAPMEIAEAVEHVTDTADQTADALFLTGLLFSKVGLDRRPFPLKR